MIILLVNNLLKKKLKYFVDFILNTFVYIQCILLKKLNFNFKITSKFIERKNVKNDII